MHSVLKRAMLSNIPLEEFAMSSFSPVFSQMFTLSNKNLLREWALYCPVESKCNYLVRIVQSFNYTTDVTP